MNINEYSFPFSSQESNNDNNKLENKQNKISDTFNYVLQNSEDFGINEKENEIEELDETDNLKYKDSKNLNPFLQQKLDSFDSKARFKYSIDIPNVSKQRLHEYLNDDLLNALDYSPNIPKLNSGNISNISNDNNANNDLLGFSLYSQPNNNNQNLNNKNENNINNLSDFSNMNNNYNDNNNYNNNYNDNNNNIQNYNYTNNNNLNYNINNPQIFIPSKLRNNEHNNQDNIEKNKNYQNYNNQIKEDIKDKNKNKLDNRNKKGQNLKKDKNNKRYFEVRAGDWTCVKCNNLNFSFRNKCNRCGLPKEFNTKFESMNTDILNPNINYQFMNENNNSNAIYLNNINNNNNMNVNNVNNNNRVTYFQK